MRALRIPLLVLATAATAFSAVAQQNQDPSKNPPPAKQQPPKPDDQPAPGPAAIPFEAQIDRQALDAAFGRKAVATTGLKWLCEPPKGQDPVRCTATGSPQLFAVSTCRQLAGRIGPVTAFRGGGRVLGGSELQRCNAGLQQAGLPGPAAKPGGGFVPQNPVPVMNPDAPPVSDFEAIELPGPAGPDLGDPTVPELDLRCDGPDPAVVKLTIYFWPSIAEPDSGKILAMLAENHSVANVGRGEWVSGELQQLAYLTRAPDGATPEITIGGDFDFPRLAPGETAPTDRGGGWFGVRDSDFYPGDTSDEFATDPPGIGLTIVYDPDIMIDGNPRNDDCNLDNNQLIVSGAQLAQWAREGREVIEVTRDGRVTFRDREG